MVNQVLTRNIIFFLNFRRPDDDSRSDINKI